MPLLKTNLYGVNIKLEITVACGASVLQTTTSDTQPQSLTYCCLLMRYSYLMICAVRWQSASASSAVAVVVLKRDR